MNMKRAFNNSWKFVKEEKLEIIVIGVVTTLFAIMSHLLPEYSKHHQYLTSYMPVLVVIVPIILFSAKFAILYKKTGSMRHREIVQPIKNRHYNSKLAITAFNASTFLMADIVLVYAFAMGFFAFAFNAGTDAFPEAWHQVHMAEIAFPILSVFALICMRRK